MCFSLGLAHLACGADKDDGGQPLSLTSYPTTPATGGGAPHPMGGSGGAGGEGGVGGATSCEASSTCATSQTLGIISGDTGTDQENTTGFRSRFVRVNVTENDSGATGASMKVYARLSSPSGVDFDLHAYLDPDSMNLACDMPYASSENQVPFDDEVSLEWGEGAVPNGGIDGRDVVFEVRHVSGTCGAASTWTLTIFGNQL